MVWQQEINGDLAKKINGTTRIPEKWGDGGEINRTYTFDKYLFFCRRKMRTSLSCHYANLYPIFHIISNT